ncbi:hypothetical protein Scep_012704 [Stephania cephalantha]|uniref:Centromere/kinetochore protein n=1 Tax=Stephania cephalantha TaxID=152367 RepID=A0AAP0JFF2_9MAGN
MDVLFGSIDVRDLLSTQTLEPSSPLSAPDLRLLIDRLQLRSLQIKDKVRDYISSHRHDFSQIFAHSSTALSNADSTAADLAEALRLVSDRPIDVEIRDAIAEISSKRRELREKKEVLGFVQGVVSLVGRLREAREGLRSGRGSGWTALMRVRVRVRFRWCGEGVLDYGLAKNLWGKIVGEVDNGVVKWWMEAKVFEIGGVRLMGEIRLPNLFEDYIEIELVLQLVMMVIVDIADARLTETVDPGIKATIAQIYTPARSESQIQEMSRPAAGGDDGGAGFDLEGGGGSCRKVKAIDFYSGIIQIVEFVYKFICYQNSRWMQCFGRLAWPRTAELIISKFLSKAVPHDASKLAEFQMIINDTAEFESALKKIMFVSTDEKDQILSNYAQNVEVHFASRKKIEILAKARNMLSKCDFVIPPEYTRKGSPFKTQGAVEIFSKQTVDLLFLPERCVISKAALRLMELVHDTLKDVCLSTTRVAMKFYDAARDALLLYEAVVPIKLEKQLSSVNQVAILVHNDCLFLSKEILGLAFEFLSAFPSSMKEHAVFVDMAPRFHQMAKEILQKQIQLVFRNLKEAIDGANGFQNTHQMQQYESAKFSIDQIVFILEKVHIIWEPLLLPSTYRKSMCAVLDFVFSKMTEDILLLDDMAAEETLQLQRLIQMTLDSLSSLFESLLSIKKKEEAQIDAHVQLDIFIPSLSKFRNLSDEYEIPMNGITPTWNSQQKLTFFFTHRTYEILIEAIFLDIPWCKLCFMKIE